MRTPPLVYIAAPYSCIEDARAARDFLSKKGMVVVSTWLDSHIPPQHADMATPEQLQLGAISDLRDAMICDAIVVLNSARSEGKAVETGIILARNYQRHWTAGSSMVPCPIVVVGKPSNIFHYHPYVKVVPTLEAAATAVLTQCAAVGGGA